MAWDQRVSAPCSSLLGARVSGPLPNGNECHRGATGALISIPGSAGLWVAS